MTEAGPARISRPQPPMTPVSAPFWDATREKRYLLQWCRDCEKAVYFPRSFCPHCSGSALEWRPASGRAQVYAFTVDYRPQHPAFGPDPYVVALIDLEEGVRVMTNVVDCQPADVRVGLPVELTWAPLDDGRNLPLYRPVLQP